LRTKEQETRLTLHEHDDDDDDDDDDDGDDVTNNVRLLYLAEFLEWEMCQTEVIKKIDTHVYNIQYSLIRN
jgi:hypothetical protein